MGKREEDIARERQRGAVYGLYWSWDRDTQKRWEEEVLALAMRKLRDFPTPGFDLEDPVQFAHALALKKDTLFVWLMMERHAPSVHEHAARSRAGFQPKAHPTVAEVARKPPDGKAAAAGPDRWEDGRE